MSTTTQTTIPALAPWPRGWRAAAGLTSVPARAIIMAGAFLR